MSFAKIKTKENILRKRSRVDGVGFHHSEFVVSHLDHQLPVGEEGDGVRGGEEISCIIDKSETLDVPTLAILADIDVGESALRINIEPLVVLLSSLNGSHIRTRHLVGKV